MGALIIRIGFAGILYFTYNKDPPPKKKKSKGHYLSPYIKGPSTV